MVITTVIIAFFLAVIEVDRQEEDAIRKDQREAIKVKRELRCTVADPEAIHIDWDPIRILARFNALTNPVEESKNNSVIPNTSAFHFSFKLPTANGVPPLEVRAVVQVQLVGDRCETIGRLVEQYGQDKALIAQLNQLLAGIEKHPGIQPPDEPESTP